LHIFLFYILVELPTSSVLRKAEGINGKKGRQHLKNKKWMYKLFLSDCGRVYVLQHALSMDGRWSTRHHASILHCTLRLV